jgi:hypothetical protein
MVGTRSKEGSMAMTGARTPSAIVPKEEQAGVDMMSLDGHPAEGRDLGAAAGMNDTARAGEAQVARDDQPRGHGERQQRKQHPKNHPKGYTVVQDRDISSTSRAGGRGRGGLGRRHRGRPQNS